MRKRASLCVFAFIALVVGWSTVWRYQHPREPIYKSRPLSDWLQDYDTVESPEKAQETDEAVRVMSSNAIPFILRQLGTHDSPWRLRLIYYAKKQRFLKFNYSYAEERRFQAIRALRALASRFEYILPSLTALVSQTNCDFSDRCAALTAIGYIGPPARTALPSVLRETVCTNYYERDAAFWALVLLRAPPEATIPTFCRGLEDTEAGIRGWAAMGLGACGTNGSRAIGNLVVALQRQKQAAQNGRIEERIAEGQMEVALARLRGELSTGDDQNEAK
jgi:HEAT repeat protein